MAHAGRSVQQDHWRDSTSRKQETLSHLANRTLSTAPRNMATTAARGGSWTMLSGKETVIDSLY